MMRDRRLWLLLAGALAVRLVLMPLPDPLDADLTTFWLPWMATGAQDGLAQLYLSGQPPVNYPPLYLALLVVLGKLYGLLVPSFEYTPLQSVLIKLPAVVADLVVGVLLYHAAASLYRSDRSPEAAHAETIAPHGKRQTVALLAAGLWLFNPAVIYVSSVWGQVDSIHTLWMLAALMAALSRRWRWSGLLMGLALLTKLQSVVIAPLLVLLAWRDGWRAAVQWTAWAAIALVAGVAPLWAGGALQPVRDVYFGAIGYYPALSMNAYNPWFVVQVLAPYVLGHGLLDTARLVGPITLRWLGMGLFAGYGLLVLWILDRRWRPGPTAGETGVRAQLRLGSFFAAGLLAFGFFMLPTEMHERYILPALAPLALPAALDRRARAAYLLLSLTVLFNLVRVLPFSPFVLRLLESIPGDRLLISIANTGLLVWWTWLYWRGRRDGITTGRLPERQSE